MSKISPICSKYLQNKHINNTNFKFKRSNEKKKNLIEKCKQIVREFLERDENSCIAPGVKISSQNQVFVKENVILMIHYIICTGNTWNKNVVVVQVKVQVKMTR